MRIHERFLGLFLAFVLATSPVAANVGHSAELEPSGEFARAGAAGGLDPLLMAQERDLRTYFEKCNNHIVSTLDDWQLKRDAGDRPTPIQMMGMGYEDASSAGKLFEQADKHEVWNSQHAPELLHAVYEQSLLNTTVAYVRLMRQYEGAQVDADAVHKKICSLGNGCQPVAYEKVRKAARFVVENDGAPAKFTAHTAAAIINQQVDKLNAELDRVQFTRGDPLSAAKLERYTKLYEQMVKQDGPMRLLAVPLLNSKVGTVQTVNANRGDEVIQYHAWKPGQPQFPARKANRYGRAYWDGRTSNHLWRVDPYRLLIHHSYVTVDEVAQAIQDGKALIEELFATLNNSVSPTAVKDWNSLQSAVSSLMGGNALAVRMVLANAPHLKSSACRAFTDFAIDRARNHRSDRYKNNAIIAGGVVVAAGGFFIPFFSHGVGAWILAAGTGISAYVAVDTFFVHGENERKLRLNVAEVLAGNESSEIILTRIPEQIERRNASSRNRYMNVGLALFSAAFVVREVKLMIDVSKGFRAPDQLAFKQLLTKQGLIEVGQAGGKFVFALGKGALPIFNLYTFRVFEEVEGTEISFEEYEGSRIMLTARAESHDSRRGYVKLRVISRKGPQGDLPVTQEFVQMPLKDFRELIQQFR